MTGANNNNGFLILAAGKGTRMKNDTPKVLHKICGKEMLSYVHDLAKSFQPERIGIITSDDAPETVRFVERNYPESEVIKQNERLGTGHAVKVSLGFFNNFLGNVVCLYGDTPFISKKSIEKLNHSLNEDSNVAVSVLGFEPKDPAKYGRLKTNKQNDLVEIVEYNDASEEERKIGFCNSGVVAIRGEHLKSLINEINNNNSKQEYYLTDIVKIAVSKGLICKAVSAEEHEVMGINSQAERSIAENVRQDLLRNKHLENGVVIQAPETVFFSEETILESGVEIEPNVIFSGDVKVGKNTKLRAFSYLEDCIIGEGNIIGPYARIRPDSELHNNVKVGNFVEIKKSTIDENSKINHLSYIGDSNIGKNVNVGAGSITCNYDGKRKFKTNIGDNSFIGSNTVIVAPVNIGKNVITGAGTTILKDLKENTKVVDKKNLTEI